MEDIVEDVLLFNVKHNDVCLTRGMNMENKIEINDYVLFDANSGRFCLTIKSGEIIYREKGVICSYSGSDDWCHQFFCQLLDLYSGRSKYNYALNTGDFALDISDMYKAGHAEEVCAYIERNKNRSWFSKAANMMATIIDDLPNIYTYEENM